MTSPVELHQLRMVWPENLLGRPLDVPRLSGYHLRHYRSGDEARFFALMSLAGWEGWDNDRLQPWLAKIIPDGWFMVVHKASDRIVGTAMALHNYKGAYPFWGELGWLVVDPEHVGRNLGLFVSAAVTSRLMDAGYRNIQLFTEDHRLPAIKTYLKLGYVPSLYVEGMYDRWKVLCEKLGWPFVPEDWAGDI
jgi:mycothiol synthase